MEYMKGKIMINEIKKTTNKFRQKIEKEKGKSEQIQLNINECISLAESLEKEIRDTEEAKTIIQAVAQITQNELEYRIEEPVSLALAAGYDNPYKMSAKFETTERGSTECKLNFERNGSVLKPLESSGGGPIDFASFALRIGGWSLESPRKRAVMCLDEPFKWVSRNKMSLAGEMMRQVAKQLNLQIIMISHIPELIESADKIFCTSINKGVTTIKEV